MQRHWVEDELALYWSLATDELAVLPPGDAGSRLGVALSLKFCQLEGHFPGAANELPPVALQYIAKQLDLDPGLATAYDWQGRTGTRYRRHLRTFLGLRPATVADVKGLEAWLRAEIVPWDHDLRHLQTAVVGWCRDHHIEPPSGGRIDRVLRSLVRTHEHTSCSRVAAALLPATRTAMEALLVPGLPSAGDAAEELPLVRQTPLSMLKGDPGRVGLKSVLQELDKLRHLEALQLPAALETLLPPLLLRRYRLRVAAEPPREVRQHPEPLRYTLLAAFCWQRRHEIIDGLVDLLIQIVDRITVRAEKKVVQELLGDLQKVRGKTTVLFKMAEAAVDHPNGTVRDWTCSHDTGHIWEEILPHPSELCNFAGIVAVIFALCFA